MAQRTAFVTGATGFLGLNLVEQLAEDGWRVVALCRPAADTGFLEALGAEVAGGDITDSDSVRRGMPDTPDAVFHVAAMTSVWKQQAEDQRRVNVDGTRNVVEAALAAGAGRFIHTSTWNVYDWSGGALTEDTPKTGDRSWINYDLTKHEAEKIVLSAVDEAGLDAVVLNPSHILGRYDRHNWARMIAMAALGRLPGVPPGAGDFAHGEAVARAHIRAVDRGKTGRNYLLGGPHATFLELVQQITDIARQPKRPKKATPEYMLRMMGRLDERVSGWIGRQPDVTPEAVEMVCSRVTIASTLARDELDYDPTPLGAAIEDSYRWLMKARIIA
jgi:nucleoside-diphosphate-sugar epimerase